MAKLTLTALAAIAKAVILNDKISIDATALSPYVPGVNGLSKLVKKVGDQFQLTSNFEDRLPEITSKDLPLGTTIEEYFMDLQLPVDHDPSGANVDAPSRPTFQDVAYSEELARKTFKTTRDLAKYENAMINEEALAQLVASVSSNLYKADAIYTYMLKKHLMGRFISRIPDSRIATSGQSMITKLAKPTDTTTGEVWIKQVKNKIEALRLLQTEDNNIKGVPARAESLILYILPEITSVIDVDVLAGSFNSDKVELPVEVKVVEDFGEITDPEDSDFVRTGAWALLVDTRFGRLHPIHHSAYERTNEEGEFVNLFLHRQYTAHFSKVVNAHVWSTTLEAEES